MVRSDGVSVPVQDAVGAVDATRETVSDSSLVDPAKRKGEPEYIAMTFPVIALFPVHSRLLTPSATSARC